VYVCELTRRKYRAKPEVPIRGPEDVYRLCRKMRRYRKEHFCALLMNARHVCVELHTVSIGTLNASLVHPREVFAPAIEQRCAAMILVHNHPSQDPSPSEEDVQLTGRLVQGGRILGIEVLDHIIIGGAGFISLKAGEHGWPAQ